MKKIFILAFVAVVSMEACKEADVTTIDYTPVDTSLHLPPDTTYVLSTVPAADKKLVLVEEATGVGCVNCPSGAKILADYEDAHPNSLVIVGLHAGALTRPLSESQYDFRTDVSAQYISFLGGDPNKPAAAFDRTKYSGIYFIDKNSWPATLGQAVTATAPVNLNVTSQYDEQKKQAIITVRATYTQAVQNKQQLTLVLTEDDIIDAQELIPTDSNTITIHGVTYHAVNGVIEDYQHNHILRDAISPILGTAVLDTLSEKGAGRVFEKTFAYKIGDKGAEWKVDNLHVVAFIANNETDNRKVLQVAEVKLK